MSDNAERGSAPGRSIPKMLPLLILSLQRVHLMIVLVSMMLTGLSLSVLSMLVLCSYAENNLQLAATAISYGVQNAVRTGNTAAIAETVRRIGATTQFSHAQIMDANNQVLIDWSSPGTTSPKGGAKLLTQWLFPQPLKVPILYQQREIGQVCLTGDTRRVKHYLVQLLKWLSGSLVVSALVAFWLSRRKYSCVLARLQNITSGTHHVRRHQIFSLGELSSSIAELDRMRFDINGLMKDLSLWQKHLQHENDNLTYQALHDALTGLPNRRAFELELKNLMSNPQTASQVAMLFIDGDRFKEVNDTYGHAAGDCVLVETAQRLRARLRNGDLVARLGGDEFAVLLSGIENGEQAAKVAANVIEAMHEPVRLADGARVVRSLSIGVALAKNHCSTEAMLAQADAAMYHIKQLGGGWYFSPSLWEQEPKAGPQMRNLV